MAKRLDITEEERSQIQKEIEHFFMFTEDVLADPSILDQMPDESEIDPIPKAEREPGRHYDVETERMVVTVTPIQREEAVRERAVRDA